MAEPSSSEQSRIPQSQNGSSRVPPETGVTLDLATAAPSSQQPPSIPAPIVSHIPERESRGDSGHSNSDVPGESKHPRMRRLSNKIMNGFERLGRALHLNSDNESTGSSSRNSRSGSFEQVDSGSGFGEPKPESGSEGAVGSGFAVPEGRVIIPYTVQSGDTLGAVAMRHGMTTRHLQQLNKLFGSKSLYFGQVIYVTMPKSEASKRFCEENEDVPRRDGPNDASLASATKSAGKTGPVRRMSAVGGEFFRPLILFDKNIQVSGEVEMNRYYLDFIPQHFAAAAPDRENLIKSAASDSLLKDYRFRLDWRDIDGVSASEVQITKSDDANNLDGNAKDDAGLSVNGVAYKVAIYWASKERGFNNPGALTLGIESLESCTKFSEKVQKTMEAQRQTSLKFAAQSLHGDGKESKTLTSGAVVSGLLFRPDVSVLSQSEDDNLESATTTVTLKRNESSFGADLVQQALLNGDLSPEEAKVLLEKQLEVESRNASLAREYANSMDRAASKAGTTTTGGKAKKQADKQANIIPPLSLTYAKMDKSRITPTFADGHPSEILKSESMLTDLHMELPDRFRNLQWNVTYDFERSGAGLRIFYEKAAGHADTLILIRSREGDIFGAFCTEEWVMSRPREYYGTGESFLFAFQGKELKIHGWSGADDFVQSSSSTHIGVGASPQGFAFGLDEELDRGSAAPSATFGLNSETLIPNTSFRVAELELITFVAPHRRGSSFDASPNTPTSSLFRQHSGGTL